MIPTIVALRLGDSGGERPGRPLLVVGPSLGTSAEALWSSCAAELVETFDVWACDLPGHGRNPHVPAEPFTMAELAQGVLRAVDEVSVGRGEPDGAFCYAGDSVGGAVGLQLLLDSPTRVRAAAVICSGARIGSEQSWRERMAKVRASGTPSVVAMSAERWFGPGFLDREPERGAALLHALSDADDEGYVRVCEALAAFDVRAELAAIAAPVLALAGAHDLAAPPEGLREVAAGVVDATYVELPGVAHLAPAEQPALVAHLLRAHFLPVSVDARRDAGMRVRREVLGDGHVDRADAATTGFTRDFQELITSYAWGEIWTRPCLDRRSRSMITLTALVAGGHHDELAMHVRAALRNGLTVEEIKEVLLQSAIYCGVPSANAAFRVAAEVLAESAEPSADPKGDGDYSM